MQASIPTNVSLPTSPSSCSSSSSGARTHGIDEHGQAAQRCDGGCEVLLRVIELLNVAANLLHHRLALLRLHE